MIEKIFAGSAFNIPPETEAEFDRLSKEITAAAEAEKRMLLASLWVQFYMKFNVYWIADLN